jgi:cytoskeletal protein RodZ
VSCGFDKGLLAAHYDGETSHGEAVEVERHIGSCPECARDLAAMKELSAALKPLRATAPLSIAEGVLRDVGTSRRRHLPWFRWGLSAAAAVLIGGIAFVVMDQRLAPQERTLAAAEKPAPASGEGNKSEYSRFKKSGEESKPSAQAPPPAEPSGDDVPAAETPAKPPVGKARGARLEKAPVPVVRVTAADVAAARTGVEAFLKERELKPVQGAPLLGRQAFVRDRYLQLDLSDEELTELEKRLSALKETTVARGSLESEKKRVAEELSKEKKEGVTLGADKERRDEEKDHAEADAGASLDKDAGKPAVVRRKVILVFEPVEAKK